MSYARILAPLDGSALAERALPLATSLAGRTGAALLLATVEPENVESSPARIREAASARVVAGDSSGGEAAAAATGSGPASPAGRYLEDVANRPVGGTLDVAWHVLSGDPANEVLRLARLEAVDLIVMATRGRSGLVRGLLGSVTDRVALAAAAPVLVVRAENAPDTIPDAASLSCVIVPLDGSELAETALEHACRLVEAFNGRIVLIQAVSPGADGEARVLAWQYLEGVASWLRKNGMKVTTEVADGDPRAEIAARSEREADSVIVIATRGATGRGRWQRGSVADGVIRTAPAPTMIVPRVTGLLGRSIH